jgi:hypothetical protein
MKKLDYIIRISMALLLAFSMYRSCNHKGMDKTDNALMIIIFSMLLINIIIQFIWGRKEEE